MLTDRGWRAAGGGLSLVGLWTAFGEVELLAVGVALLLGCLSAMTWVWLKPPRVNVTRQVTPSVLPAGASSVIDLKVASLRRRARNVTIVETAANLGEARFSAGRLRRGTSYEGRYRLEGSRRGVHVIKASRVSVEDPFRLAEGTAVSGHDSRIIVYPHIEDLTSFPQIGGRGATGDASKRERARRGGEDFYTLREFRSGDDLRRIHWPSSAKRDELMIREMELPWQRNALVILDPRRHRYRGGDAFDKAASGAASVLAHLSANGAPVDLWTGRAFTGGTGSNLHPQFEALALIRPTPGLDLTAAAARLPRRLAAGIVVVTGNPDHDLLLAAEMIGDRTSTIVLMTVDARPEALTPWVVAGHTVIGTSSHGSWSEATGTRKWQRGFGSAS